jgi:hypothetical protein
MELLIGIALILVGSALRRWGRPRKIIVEHRFVMPPRGPGDPIPHPALSNIVRLDDWRKAS